jgi:hypothetical protein
MKDMHNNIAVDQAIGLATLAADNVPVAVDLSGFKSAEIFLAIGAGGITFTGTNKIEFKLTHSDDNLAYDDVVDADMLGVSDVAGGIIKDLKTAHASAVVSRFGYKGNRRYLKLLADFSGTHGTGTPIAAMVVKGEPRNAPKS